MYSPRERAHSRPENGSIPRCVLATYFLDSLEDCSYAQLGTGCWASGELLCGANFQQGDGVNLANVSCHSIPLPGRNLLQSVQRTRFYSVIEVLRVAIQSLFLHPKVHPKVPLKAI